MNPHREELRRQSSTPQRALEQVAQRGILEDCGPVLLQSTSNKPGYEEATCTGRLSVADHTFRLRIRLPWSFPRCLPVISIEGMTPALVLPHGFSDNTLCYTSDLTLLDRKDPESIIEESLLRVRHMLHELVTGNRGREFLREAVAYWEGSAEGSTLDCLITVGDEPRIVSVLQTATEVKAVADDAETYSRSRLSHPDERLHTANALYLPLSPDGDAAGFRVGELATPTGLRAYVRRLPDGLRTALTNLISRCDKSWHLLILGLERKGADRALLGLELSQLEQGHPLLTDNTNAKVKPIHLVRWDRSYLLPRGGAEPDLQKCKVLIAGCGSVGGHLAMALARAGVGHLSLVDPDVLAPENTYRHVCGMPRSRQPKVLALSAEILSHMPYIEVEPVFESVEGCLKEYSERLRSYDLVIAAMGIPVLDLHLNEWTWMDAGNPPVLFAWLEPYGLGGHTLLTHVAGQPGRKRGCLECLYERPVEGGPLENRAAFAAPGVSYGRDVLGCGTSYLPFANLDAQRTAELAARLALRSLRKETDEATLFSWKGDSAPFQKAGYTVTPRFLTGQDTWESHHSDFRRLDCPICAPT
ncbi:ThiF family adenylyltransferase [Corallococcus sp. M7]